MKMRTWLLLAVVVLGAAAAFLLLRKGPSDRELIDDLLLRLEQAIEQKQLSRITACIADDYEDDSGLTKRDLTGLAFQYIRSQGRADVVLSDVQIEIEGRSAVARLHAEVTYVEGGMRTRPFTGSVSVFFRKEGRHWYIVKSEGWQTAAAAAAEE